MKTQSSRLFNLIRPSGAAVRLVSTLLFTLLHHATAQPPAVLVKLNAPPVVSPDPSSGTLQKPGLPPLASLAGRPELTDWRPFLANRPVLASTERRRERAFSERRELEKWIVLSLAGTADAEEFAAYLRQLPDVVYAGTARSFHLDYVPQDPLFSRQYGLAKVEAVEGWDSERGRREVVIGVIDTGIDYDHPDLAANLWINPGEDLDGNGRADSLDVNGIDDDGNGYIDDVQGWDFTDAPNYPDGGDYRDRDADPIDEMGHGTAVAGIIAAVADNDLGISGLAPGCRLMNLRAFTAGGNGEEDDVAAAILYAIENGAAVINMSWGDVFVSRLLDDVIQYAAAMNTVLVASSGNSATDQIHYPSAYSNTISVGSTDAADQLAGFSNYGPSLDIVAPGVNVLSTVRHAAYDSSLNGTSFSAPFVSAAAALLISQDSSRSPDAVRAILTTSAEDLGPQGWDVYYGAGRLNLAKALSPQLTASVRIHYPWLDQGFQKGPIEITGSAWTPSMSNYTLEWGLGDNPSAWSEITARRTERVIDGLLGTWDNLPAQDSSYTIRLIVRNSNGSMEQSQVRIFIDQTAPVISDVRQYAMFDAENASSLIEYRTDDLCMGSLLVRTAGSADTWQEVPMNYRSDQPRIHLTRELGAGTFDVKIQARNTAGLTTLLDTLLQVDLSQPPLNTMRYGRLEQRLPHGHLLDQTADFNGDGRPEMIIGYFDEKQRLFTAFFSRNETGFNQIYSLPEAAIPRSIGDSDGDGVLELLAGYGFTTWLYEVNGTEPFSMGLVRRWQGDGSTQYWGSRLADLNGDGRSEIILRVVRSGESATDQFEVWGSSGGGEFSTLAVLPNPTAGDNYYGVPRCEVADFDGDGRSEILLGDSDGDIYIYETEGTLFTNTWHDRLPLLDAIDFIAAGDFDGDGEAEFAAGCHSDPDLNTEHAYDSRHWCYRIYDRNGDNSYQPVAEWRFFGYESAKDFESGVSSGDADDDGRDELFMAVFPDLYVAEYLPGSGYELGFHAAAIRTNAVAVTDSDNDSLWEFWASDGNAIRPWVLTESLTGPPMPVGLAAKPRSAAAIDLSWHAVPGAQQYLLYRGPSPDALDLYRYVAPPAFTDTLVRSGELYFYAVASQDTTRTPRLSSRSSIVSARPGAQPGLVSAVASSERAIRLRFSKPMDISLLQDVRHYLITPEMGHPASALPLASGAEVQLHMPAPFPSAGRYRVEVSGLEDRDGTPMDSAQSRCEFEISFTIDAPYLTAVYALANGVVELTFNEPMQRASLEERINYDAGTGMQVAWAEAVAPGYQSVRLHLTGSVAWGAVGKPLTIRVSGLVSALGVPLKPGRGDIIQLLYAAATLDKVHTFPNPYRQGVDTRGIIFADLTPEAEIRIMTTAGRTLRILYENNGDGGLEWDVRDDHGRPVPAGIYLYRVVSGTMVKMGKLAVVK